MSERTLLFSPTDAPLTLTSERTSTAGGDTAEGPTDGTPMFLKLSRDERFIVLNFTVTAPSALQPIRLETLELSPSCRLIRGKVAVLNIAFQKFISIFFSWDDWKTVSEVAAEHLQSHHEGHSVVSDLFSFVIDKDNLPLDTGNILQLCARYAVANQVFWDNNNGRNYLVYLAT
ncbi:hypothetical protein PENSTE_c017G05850 [Penicillium steckii]|uniref:CBM21 domain-containing protein n=1 Tax=Penicillium steckii TaxID=303698 RepID=A0A1V6SX62_9EURO|nr:hypothetical protein PENSTE_c017G05850 [Penicillium steckii]